MSSLKVVESSLTAKQVTGRRNISLEAKEKLLTCQAELEHCGTQIESLELATKEANERRSSGHSKRSKSLVGVLLYSEGEWWLGIEKARGLEQGPGIKTDLAPVYLSWFALGVLGQAHMIQGRNFWTMDYSRSGSWIWKQLCRLRPLARLFLVCEVGRGLTASFWMDNWTGLGPLLDLTGESGPRISGLNVQAVVAEAITEGRWWLAGSRSRNPVIALLKTCLPLVDQIWSSESEDVYRWKIGESNPSSSFLLLVLGKL
ncbi:unnamed protein product [Microthlaspi erraticum]|uniref:Reverse transcriptase zinc-binding domain-containing protein n=1 Tax=Microthlaspi erraticum TaxID=1685480 RepID=A0A6D2I4W0_9BRAS|nr:unnamed protein product [Microthlaspi erraticum]